ncbi:PLP-dependent aminotransferase family protein [Clostridium sp. BL-8]|uniref:MocR-like pyridoxine biosynthesis transcription factor PdxR n=1 Tax=Clostridium sp. BL-8 TaxID=349938 RepID=UPI00098C7CC6|nr:PLP-dependent aminotransferase family protein [Clostridium sp. BL-8]OOM80464.1 HTH-type transcriptional regulatory protein GabR [Clostridium sp. BL-8]
MIVLDINSEAPLYLQIYKQLKEQIISGEISEGQKLPSTRKLSTSLNVSRNTVENAYMQLSSEGYIKSKAGSGFIAQKLDKPIILRQEKIDTKTSNFSKSNIIDNNINLSDYNPYYSDGYDYKYNFEYGKLSSEDFPLRIWKRVSNKCLSTVNSEDMTSYSSSTGEIDLQKEIMNYLKASRGVSCTPSQIIISSGSEYCLSLLSQLFRGSFDEIAVEDPGYSGAKDIFINNGYKAIPISLEDDGINVNELETTKARIVYTTPSHQFPTGVVIPIAKRLKLLDWAKRKNGIIIEDDYDSELRYNSKPIPSMQSIDSNDSVIYIGTFSKCFSPSLRMNYMVLPKQWLERYYRHFKMYQTPVPLIHQKIMQQFMHLGHFERHLHKIYLINKKKHDILIQTIQDLMGDNVSIYAKNAGLHILLQVNNGLTEEELINKAKDHGVKVYPVSFFWIKKENYSNNMVLLGFGGMFENDIIEGIKLLNKAWFTS